MDILKKVSIFTDLNEEELKSLSEIAIQKSFHPEQKIFSEGETGDGFYIISEGKVRISIILPGIGEELLALLRKNSHFGEMAMIEDKPRSASAIADTDVTCYFFEKNKFNEFISKNKETENKILWGFLKEISARLRRTDNKLKEILLLIKSF